MILSKEKLHSLLSRVTKPGQYLGNEVNVIRKDFDSAKVRVCLVFPDKYEIGMSHMGLKILYDILNNIPDVVAERCYAPELDMERLLREEKLPLFSLESKRPLADFDMIGMSFTYELTYINALNILDLAQIPLWQKDRNDSHPLIVGGGGCMMNAEPMADFLDAACLGDGEELILDIVNAIRDAKNGGAHGRAPLLDRLSTIEGIYIPSFFEPHYNDDGTIKEIRPLKEGYTKVNKRVLQNLDRAAYPTKTLVPSIRVVHDRIGIEIQRGCNRACRFCQAGYIDRPVRQRSPENILEIAEESRKATGLESISLLSLSAADYATIVPLMKELNSRYSKKKISISVPATRTEKLTPELIEQIKQVRKTGFTIAPEAGTARMRRVINKGNKVDDLYRAVTNAFSAGWELLKLYYMVGLPYETDEDVVGIAAEANEAIKICLSYTKRADLNLSISSFVPKPFTPFQWDPQMTIEETKRKYNLIKHSLAHKRVHFKHHDAEMSYVEGLLSRGDRRVSQALYIAFKEGCRFDQWEENFSFTRWQMVLDKWGGDVGFYLHRRRNKDEILPWEHLFAQMEKRFLWEELEKAHDAAFTEDCSVAKCSDCGVCDFKIVKNRIFVEGDQPVMVKKGNREAYGWNGVATPRPDSSDQMVVTSQEEQKTKYRFRFSKLDEAAFFGHLEMVENFKKAVKRAELPVTYSQGFHPHMKIAMGHPLPVGVESEWEYFDLELARFFEPNDVFERIQSQLPIGLVLTSVELIDRSSPSLYSGIDSLLFEVDLKPVLSEGKFLAATFIQKAKTYDESETFVWTRRRGDKTKVFDIKKQVALDSSQLPEKLTIKTKMLLDGSLSAIDVLKAVFGLENREISLVGIKKAGIDYSITEPALVSIQNPQVSVPV